MLQPLPIAAMIFGGRPANTPCFPRGLGCLLFEYEVPSVCQMFLSLDHMHCCGRASAMELMTPERSQHKPKVMRSMRTRLLRKDEP